MKKMKPNTLGTGLVLIGLVVLTLVLLLQGQSTHDFGGPPGTVGETDIAYLDTFGDASLDATWTTHNVDANHTITEAAGILTITAANAVEADWCRNMDNECAKAITGPPGYPLVAITKLNSYTVNNYTMGGIAMSVNPENALNNAAILFGRFRDSDEGGGVNGLGVYSNATLLASNAETTLPIWLRVRMVNGVIGGNVMYFDYSDDGITYLNLYSTSTPPDPALYDSWSISLFASQWNNTTGIAAPFDFFTAYRDWGPQ